MKISIYNSRKKWAFGIHAVVLVVLLSIGDFEGVRSMFKPEIFVLPKNLIGLIGTAYTITSLIIYGFKNWLWRFLPEGLSGRPNLNGAWMGKINYVSKNDQEKEAEVSPVFLVIKQNFLDIQIFLYTEQSSSHSLTADLYEKENDSWECSYTYDNTPDRKLRKESPRHRGAAEIKIFKVCNNYKIRVEYWSDRWSQGEMEFSNHRNKFATNYESACEIFNHASNTTE